MLVIPFLNHHSCSFAHFLLCVASWQFLASLSLRMDVKQLLVCSSLPIPVNQDKLLNTERRAMIYYERSLYVPHTELFLLPCCMLLWKQLIRQVRSVTVSLSAILTSSSRFLAFIISSTPSATSICAIVEICVWRERVLKVGLKQIGNFPIGVRGLAYSIACRNASVYDQMAISGLSFRNTLAWQGMTTLSPGIKTTLTLSRM